VLVTGQVVGALIFGAVAAPFHWVPLTAPHLLLIGLLGVVSLAAFLLVNRALRLAPASVVVPYQYTLIVWAVIFGYWFFGDEPEPHMLVGAAIIVGSGLMIFLREQQLARRTGEPTLPPA
jgi:drug/metabolite transporter (DMT)-like permease